MYPNAGATATDLPMPEPGAGLWLLGIGGCGMCGLARLLNSSGYQVAGVDSTPSDVTRSLAQEGIQVHQEDTMPPADTQLMIASAAITEDHPQRQWALDRNVPVITYAQALGMVQQSRLGVCIAGTHGKSTTAAMLAWILLDTGLDPSFIIGATCPPVSYTHLTLPTPPYV